MKPLPKVGDTGEFRMAGTGSWTQCVVTGYDDPPYERMILIINYHHKGEVRKGAMIGVSEFRPSSSEPAPA